MKLSLEGTKSQLNYRREYFVSRTRYRKESCGKRERERERGGEREKERILHYPAVLY